MKQIIASTLFVLLLYSCKKETIESQSNVGSYALPSSYNTLFQFVVNPSNNYLLAHVAEFQNLSGDLIVFDPNFNVVARTTVPFQINNIVCDGNHYYIMAGEKAATSYAGCIYLKKYDQYLNFISSVRLDSLMQFNLNYETKLALNSDGTIGLYETNSKAYKYIKHYLFDKNLNILRTDTSGNPDGLYTSNPRVRIVSVRALADGSNILLSRMTRPDYTGYILEKRDAAYNLIWSKSVGTPVDYTLPFNILDMDNGKLAVVGSFGVNFYGKAIYVSYFDVNGNQLQEKTIPSVWFNYRHLGIKTDDGGILVATQSDQNKGSNHVAVVTKLDASLNEVAVHTHGGSRDVAFFPIMVNVGSNQNVLAYLDNSFATADKSGGYHLVLCNVDGNGELIK